MASARIQSLDGIRAVSILFVIANHMVIDIGWEDPLHLGSLGVRIFFIISGYLITGILLDELSKAGRINLLRFYYRRSMRIFPAFYFYIGCMLLLGAASWVTLSWWDALPAITYTSNYFDNDHLKPLVMHTWSLASEEQFYLVWPCALMLAGRQHAIWALFILAAVAEVSAQIATAAFHSRVPSFFNAQIMLGCLFALVQSNVRKNSLYRRWISSSFGAFLAFLMLAANYLSFQIKGTEARAVSLLLNFIIIFALDWAIVNYDNVECRWLNSRPIVYIGVLSYSMYLWQAPFTGAHTAFPADWGWITNPIIQICGVAVCTLFSYYLVERPILRRRGKLEPIWFNSVFPSR